MSWISNRSSQESLDILGTLSEACGRLGGPVTGEVLLLVRNKDYLALVNYDIDYSRFTESMASINDAIYARQILGFFQKLDFLNLGFDKQEVAASRFVLSEQMCRKTNFTFGSTSQDQIQTAGPDIASVLFSAQCKITSILGEVPSLDKFAFAFGPGANTNINSALACPRAKLGAPLVCSTNMTRTVGEFLEETPHWAALHSSSESEDSYVLDVAVAPGKVIFVPKNAKTDRSIVVEPLINSFFQKGIGGYIKDRLMRSGVDLFDQTKNQQLARRGSVDGSLATLDLSMASDCLARNLVFSLLPYDWSDLLDQTRTSEVLVPDAVKSALGTMYSDARPHYLEKFSSMGNGYTFELESVIFYGLCFGVCEVLGLPLHDVSVYGDDLIVPIAAVSLLKEVLAFCGFKVNSEKSFAQGHFRESCGADYLYGFDIRPFYLKTLISDRNLYTMHNWFIRHCERELAEIVLSITQPHLQLFGPDGYGDGHLIGAFNPRQNRSLFRSGWCGGFFDTYVLKPRSFAGSLPGDAILPVYSIYTRSGLNNPTDPNIIRGSYGYAKISIYTLVRNIFSRRH